MTIPNSLSAQILLGRLCWRFGRICRRVKRFFSWVFVTNIPQGDKSEAGFGPFTALATFALSQSVALTAVAKGRGRDGVVLTLYAMTTTATIVWIWLMLNSTRSISAEICESYFDKPTMRFGRLTLAWTFILSAVLFVLGLNELLPNQSHKEPFNEKVSKKCLGRIDLGDARTIDSRIDPLPILEWLPQSADPERERFAIIQQADPFSDSYFDFTLDLVCSQSYQIGRRMAFLANSDGPLNLRPLQFVETGSKPSSKATILVQNAEPNDRVLVFAFVQNPGRPGVFGKAFEEYEFRLMPSTVSNQ